jgi:hypothetical protein
MVAHRKFLSLSENVGKSSADSNFSITNLFVCETPGDHVFYIHFESFHTKSAAPRK